MLAQLFVLPLVHLKELRFDLLQLLDRDASKLEHGKTC